MKNKILTWLYLFSVSSKYPTRTVEHAFNWIMIVWSYSVIAHTQMLNGRTPAGASNVYMPMLELMSAQAWGFIGLTIGFMRLVALLTNGSWRPTPELRLLGAAWSMMFWIAVVYCYHVAVVINGAPDFPMRRAFYVFIIFELYSCYRCGQDIGKRNPSRLMGNGYG